MKYKKEELINALTIIKNVCSNNHCDKCPFYYRMRCHIDAKSPFCWDIDKLNIPEEWRASTINGR